jgi:ribosome recycling factor
MTNVIKDTEAKMGKALDQLQNELSKIRTGRAHTSLLDGVKVSCYGTLTPLSQVASVNVEDARTLTVSPWDKSLVADIEKAILMSELGLNPASHGDLIRIPLPPLSEERRKDFVKQAKSQGESSKISIRNIRRDALSIFKDQVKEKEITEDDERKLQSQVQDLTDSNIAQVEKLVAAKEDDLLKI